MKIINLSEQSFVLTRHKKRLQVTNQSSLQSANVKSTSSFTQFYLEDSMISTGFSDDRSTTVAEEDQQNLAKNNLIEIFSGEESTNIHYRNNNNQKQIFENQNKNSLGNIQSNSTYKSQINNLQEPLCHKTKVISSSLCFQDLFRQEINNLRKTKSEIVGNKPYNLPVQEMQNPHSCQQNQKNEAKKQQMITDYLLHPRKQQYQSGLIKQSKRIQKEPKLNEKQQIYLNQSNKRMTVNYEIVNLKDKKRKVNRKYLCFNENELYIPQQYRDIKMPNYESDNDKESDNETVNNAVGYLYNSLLKQTRMEKRSRLLHFCDTSDEESEDEEEDEENDKNAVIIDETV